MSEIPFIAWLAILIVWVCIVAITVGELRREKYRFSISTMLIVVALISTLLGFVVFLARK
jgi:Na+-driven multidrug efflux pump